MMDNGRVLTSGNSTLSDLQLATRGKKNCSDKSNKYYLHSAEQKNQKTWQTRRRSTSFISFRDGSLCTFNIIRYSIMFIIIISVALLIFLYVYLKIAHYFKNFLSVLQKNVGSNKFPLERFVSIFYEQT
jgi:hypothetical protein